MKLSIIVPTYKRQEILQKTIDSAFEAINGLQAEVIIVNDGPDYTGLRVHEDILFFHNPKRGVSSARNFGFSKSSGEIIIFLDNDILLTRSTLDHFLQLVDKYPNAIFNPNWEYPEALKALMETTQFGRFLLKTGNYNYQAWAKEIDWGQGPIIEANQLATFCLVMKRDHFEKIGDFDEEIHFGEEDLELARRAKTKGYELYIDESVFVYHNEEDRVDINNKLNRMKIVGAMLRANQFSYSNLKKLFLFIQSWFAPILFWSLKKLPNLKSFDKLYFFVAHRLLANSIFLGFKEGHDNEVIEKNYSKLE